MNKFHVIMSIFFSACQSALNLIWVVLLFFIGPLFAIVTFVITNHGTEIKDRESIGPLIWALIAYVVGQDLSNILSTETKHRAITDHMDRLHREFDSKIDESVNIFQKDVHSRFRIAYIEENEVNDAILMALRSATIVKNTYVNLTTVTGSKTFRSHSVIDHYLSVLNKDKATWIDIVGISDLLDGRFEHLYGSERANIKGAHEIHMFNTSAPIMNFILCGPSDAPLSDVFFGWVKDNNNIVPVFHSKDERLIALFDTYFETILKTKDRVINIPIEYTRKEPMLFKQSVVHRLCGRWISVSGPVKSANSGVNGRVAGSYDIKQFAIMEIKYEDGWKIRGKTYDFKTRELGGGFESDMAFLFDNRLYYKFTNKTLFHDLDLQGIGTYSVKDDENILSGYYVRSGSPNSSRLRAIKIDSGGDGHIESSIMEGLLKKLIGTKVQDPA